MVDLNRCVCEDHVLVPPEQGAWNAVPEMLTGIGDVKVVAHLEPGVAHSNKWPYRKQAEHGPLKLLLACVLGVGAH